MKYIVITFLGLLFSIYSCSPSLYQLERFELAKAIEKGYLIVHLENHSEEIMLLKKYGQHKKAERIARKDSKYNSNIKEAISNNYSHSIVVFTYNNKHSKSIEYETLTGEKIKINSNENLFNLSINKIKNYQNDREKENLILRITPSNNTYLTPSDIIVEANVGDNLNGYNFLIKKINSKLYKLVSTAQEI